ncbi:MAG: tetratricopeptide repeat protein [Anaerolineaceae bacterium]|nr:tetratricopeptide repeat protein [Anaerolineaceae bacterium]
MALEISLLGNFEIKQNGESIFGFSTDKVRALLSFLAVEHARPHHRQQLSTLLWPDQPDNRSRHNLRQALSNLKQSLPGDNYFDITPQTIQLTLNQHIEIDVVQFSALAQTCSQHHHENLNHCLPCINRQQNMLELYDGEFLDHFPVISSEPFEEWLLITRESFHQLAMQALNILMNFHERRGEIDQALIYSKQLTQYAPWNEEGYRKTICFLASKGKRTDALVEYKRCKNALEKEFSIPPTEETENLITNIKENTFLEIKIPPRPVHPNTSFVGRESELHDIAELLTKPECRMLTLIGAGGSGKTRLALEIAEQHVGIFSDGIHFTPLIHAANCTEIIQNISQILNLPPEPEPLLQIKETLKDKHLLLILDNFEHLVNECNFISEILLAAPQIKILITSRERLCLNEEWVFNIEGLQYSLQSNDEDFLENDAFQLFIQRAKQVKQTFSPKTNTLEHINKICTLVEGFPLGIELAASTIADQSCASIAQALSENLSSIALPLRNLPERHFSLQAAFNHSWKLLPENERDSLAKLSIFAGAFNREIAIQITGTSSDELTNLVKRSLLKLAPDERYSFHQVIHQFAYECLDEPTPLQNKHAEYFSKLAKQCFETYSPKMVVQFQHDRADILAAWNWILESKISFNLLHDLLPALSSVFMNIGPLSEGQALLEKSIEIIQNQKTIDTNLIYQLILALGNINLAQCKYDHVLQNATYIIENSAILQDHAQAKLLLGHVYGAKGEPEKADSILQQALSYSENNDDLHLKMNILNELSRAKARNSEFDISIIYAQQALNIAQKINNLNGQALALSTLGLSNNYQGNTREALTFRMQALDMYISLQDRRNEARMCNNLADTIAEEGDLGRSLEYSQRALDIHTEMGNEQRKGFVLQNLGATYWELGDYEKAKSIYLQTLRIYKTINIPHAEAEIFGNLALTEISLGNLEMAQQYIEKSIGLSVNAENKANLANAYQYLGRIALLMGNTTEAVMVLQNGMKIRAQIPHPARIAEYQIELANVAYEASDLCHALELCQPVITLAEQKNAFSGADYPLRIYYILWKILSANQQENAITILANGIEILHKRAALITNPKYRKSFLENVEFHRKLLADYQATLHPK